MIDRILNKKTKLKNINLRVGLPKLLRASEAMWVKADDYFGLILLFTFLIKEKSESLPGLRATKIKGRILQLGLRHMKNVKYIVYYLSIQYNKKPNWPFYF